MKLKKARLSKTVYVPGFKELKTTIDNTTTPGVRLEAHTLGVLCYLQGNEFIIPWAMVECVVTEASDEDINSVKAS